MPGNALAVFAPKAPVEPTAPTQDRANDNGSNFKDFMDTATHKVDTAQKPSKKILHKTRTMRIPEKSDLKKPNPRPNHAQRTTRIIRKYLHQKKTSPNQLPKPLPKIH